jgi:DNA (cytosine-5)-methyltransferase 1
MKVASFFAGIGGFDLALNRVGMKCVWACENAAFPRKVYRARFGFAPQGNDIREVKADEIEDTDLWCGGFPCQDLSVAGKRGGLNTERSGMRWSGTDLLTLADRAGFSSRMFPDCSIPTTGGISQALSYRWKSAGMAWRGECLTHSISESPSAAVASSLSDILERHVPPKYFLSAKACKGILKRSERRGVKLPEALRVALTTAARKVQS